MKIWFTSDTHFGHRNIIRYCKRPFKDLKDMNKRIIRNWNARIKEGDMVFHLGDFCFRNSSGNKGEGINKKAEYWLSKLNGNIIVVRGNHDKNNSMNTPIKKIELRYGGKDILLTHDPLEFTKREKKRFDLLLCGHVHEAWKKTESKIINVGVDVWNFMPVSFEQILKEANKPCR